MNPHDRIVIDPEILVGKPVVKGTRLSVDFLLGLLAQGWQEAEILRNYPGLQREDLLACQMPITSEQALRIARLDAEKAYRDLSPYFIHVQLDDDGWHIDYELKNTKSHGGGPHYVIDAQTGAILAKRYEQ